MIAAVDPEAIPSTEESDTLLKFASRLAKFKDALKLLKLKYKFEKGIFNRIDINEISDLDNSNSSNSSVSSIQLNSSQHSTPNTTHVDRMAQSASEFIAMAHRMINYMYAGDPLALDSFIDAIDLLKELVSEDHKDIFLKFVMTRLEGIAREAIFTAPQTVDDIFRQLR